MTIQIYLQINLQMKLYVNDSFLNETLAYNIYN